MNRRNRTKSPKRWREGLKKISLKKSLLRLSPSSKSKQQGLQQDEIGAFPVSVPDSLEVQVISSIDRVQVISSVDSIETVDTRPSIISKHSQDSIVSSITTNASGTSKTIRDAEEKLAAMQKEKQKVSWEDIVRETNERSFKKENTNITSEGPAIETCKESTDSPKGVKKDSKMAAPISECVTTTLDDASSSNEKISDHYVTEPAVETSKEIPPDSPKAARVEVNDSKLAAPLSVSATTALDVSTSQDDFDASPTSNSTSVDVENDRPMTPKMPSIIEEAKADTLAGTKDEERGYRRRLIVEILFFLSICIAFFLARGRLYGETSARAFGNVDVDETGKTKIQRPSNRSEWLNAKKAISSSSIASKLSNTKKTESLSAQTDNSTSTIKAATQESHRDEQAEDSASPKESRLLSIPSISAKSPKTSTTSAAAGTSVKDTPSVAARLELPVVDLFEASNESENAKVSASPKETPSVANQSTSAESPKMSIETASIRVSLENIPSVSARPELPVVDFEASTESELTKASASPKETLSVPNPSISTKSPKTSTETTSIRVPIDAIPNVAARPELPVVDSSEASNESHFAEAGSKQVLPISGTLSLLQELTALIVYFVPSSRPFLGANSTSPQRQALEWLAANENLDSYPLWKRLQRYALATLYFSTNGDDWFLNTDWLSDNDECTWGSRNLLQPACDDAGQMHSLFLNKNGLNGTIPADLSLLSNSLKDLQLEGGAWDCHLVGTIPSELSSMTNLISIHLQSNRLGGSFPSGLERLTNLETLHLDSNALKGPIPSDIGALSSLQRFTIGKNALTSSLPLQLALVRSLEEAKFHDNDITGDIPSQMVLVPTLHTLWLFGNKHSGSIPTEVGLMTSLQDLRLQDNMLDGSLPSELGVLSLLTTLKLSSNSIGDAIPSQIGSLSDLVELDLAANHLTGSIPSSFGDLTSLRGADRCTALSSAGVELPCEVIYPSPLDRYVGGLRLHGNRLAGSIPEDLQLLTDLRVLTLFGNKLSGTFDCPDAIEHCLVSCAKSDPTCRVLKPGLLSTLAHLAFDG